MLSVAGCSVPDGLLSSTECNRTGGDMLTITGQVCGALLPRVFRVCFLQNFGESGATVLIGAALCNNTQAGVCLSSPTLIAFNAA